MNSVVAQSRSELYLASEIYHIVSNLVMEGKISGNPENIIIERVDRPPIFPCRRSKQPDTLNLEQLKWAADRGRFWFFGPIKSVRVNLGKGRMNNYLVSELNRMVFVTTLNDLNYDSFVQMRNSLVKSATELGFRVEFSQPLNSHNVKVTTSADKSLSAQNVTTFLKGIEKLLKSL